MSSPGGGGGGPRRSPNDASETPETVYQRRLERFDAEAEDLARRSRAFATGRLLTFAASFLVLVVLVFSGLGAHPAGLGLAGALFAAFLVLVGLDERLRRRLERARSMARANRHALARLDRRWDDLPLPPAPPDGLPAAARDLHLFGRASLSQLLGTVATAGGWRVLGGWLLDAVAPGEEAPDEPALAERQRAARAFAAGLDFRQRLEALGAEVGTDTPRLDRFYEWAEGEPWLARRPLVRATAWLLTVAVPLSIVAHAAGWVDYWLWVPVGFVAYLFSAVHSGALHERFDRASAGGDGFAGYGALFAHLEELPTATPHLEALARRLAPAQGRPGASEQMARLARANDLADTRHGLFHIIVQVLTQWDFHVLGRLERWQRQSGASARDWLEALAEVEALAALASVAHAHPDWAWPEVGAPVAGDGVRLTAEELGHPLLAPADRVDNPVTLGPPGTFLLVTGSNMSGKTTLLRAVGANVVLAQAGAPVAARALATPRLVLATSIGVEDSLSEGISYFMAELLRLKSVVAVAEAPPRGRTVLFLLDEILRGTNSGERQIAVSQVIGHLVRVGAIGAVTTHDLEILAEGRLEDAARTIHFRETLTPRPDGGTTMSFDYTARPGLAPTTNALRLLEAVGLGGLETPPDGERE
jgi:hypothetical protein